MRHKIKILFISHHIDPFDDKGGSYQRTNLLLRACTEIADVDVVAFHRGVVSKISNCRIVHSDYSSVKHKDPRRIDKLMKVFQPWDPYAIFCKDEYKVKVVRAVLNSNDYDYVVTRYIPKALECGLLEYARKLVIDVDDLPSDAFWTASFNAKTLRNRLWLKLMSINVKITTRRILKKVHFSFSPNPSEVYKYRSAYLPNIPFHQLITCPEVDFQKTSRRIFFIGDLDYYPNYSGIDHFIEHIYINILNKIPDCEFYICGRISDNELKKKWEAYQGVKVLGFVDELTKEYAESRVVVVPIYHGGGTNIKLLEALQMKRACVATEFATRGYRGLLTHNVDYLVARNDHEFNQFVIELITEEKRNKMLAQNGHEKVSENFSYPAFSGIVRHAFMELMENKF
ncbi:MAG TPA: glycosyltransferase [Bacteroidales bacterium]|nr:glycosyltransferase [Bacteroidales bacterium]